MHRRTISSLATLAVLTGCASGPADGDIEPAGFTSAQTSRAALSTHAFVTSGGTVMTSTAGGSKAWKTLGDAGAIEAVMLGSYRDGVRVASTARASAWVDVLPVGAAASTGQVRRDGALVIFDHVFPGVTSVFGASPTRVEETLSVDAPAHFPALSYHLVPNADFGRWSAGDDGSYYAFAKNGTALFALRPPTVEDAAGKLVQGAWSMTEEASGASLVTASFDLAGLVYPLLVDPTFETPTWSTDTTNQPGGLAAPASSWDPTTACSVLFGGAKNTFVPVSEVRLHCANGWQSTDATASASTKPTPRAYAAMSQGPKLGGVTKTAFVFGGTDASGQILDDMWALSLTGADGARTGTWTSIPAPSPKTATNWPSPRILHGMAKDANGHLVLWGGVDKAGTILSDTWTWNGTSWTSVACSGAACFTGSYGFAAVAPTAGDTNAYAIGGYAGGAFTNAVYAWNGTTWSTITTRSADMPTSRFGSLLTTYPAGSVSPLPRYVAFGARTNTSAFLFGSGVSFDAAGNDVYQEDLWTLPSSPSGAQWVSVSTADSTFQPGRRESPAAVYEESRGQTLLFGGGTSATSNSVTQSSRIYKGRSDTVILVTRKNGSGYDLAAEVLYGTGFSNTGVEGYFVARDAAGVWHPISAACGTAGVPLTAPATLPFGFTIPGSLFCTATAASLAALGTLTGFGVRSRDRRSLVPTQTCGGGACNPFDGVATCAVPTSSGVGCGGLP